MLRTLLLTVLISSVLSSNGLATAQIETANPTQPARQAAQPTVAAAASGCVSDWYVSYGGTGSFQLLWTDPDGIPVEDLRFDYGYHDPFLYSMGYLRFDNDNYSDVFSAVPRPDGALQWRYWDKDSTGWNNLAYAYEGLNTLRFGDFEGDEKTDVFSVYQRLDGAYQWKYSDDGISSYKLLAYANYPIERLRFGNFDGDLKTDVFVAIAQIGGIYDWVYSSGGAAGFTLIGSSRISAASLAFGDVQGGLTSTSDGFTDFFYILPNGGPFGDGSPEYVWYSQVAGQSQNFYFPAWGGINLNDLRFGNFDRDEYTDIYYQTFGFGLFQWHYIAGKGGAVHNLAFGVEPVSALRFADIDGDRTTDVLRVQQRCSVFIPLVNH